MSKLFQTIVSIFVFLLLAQVAQGQSLIFTVQLDLDNQTLLATGSNLGPNPIVIMGNEAGVVDQLNVTASGANFVLADLLTTAPGTYLVLVVNGPSVGFADVTIGPRAITEETNTALGIGALTSNTGLANTATGGDTLSINTTGSANTATGDDALRVNTTGSNNTATGADALRFNTTGSFNTATGLNALFSNTTGSFNTATGISALESNTTGTVNTATGVNALRSNTEGRSNTATGSFALDANTTGNSNTATGEGALVNNSIGFSNTATGAAALNNNTTGSSNTAIGDSALINNSIGSGNTAIGRDAGANADGNSNIYISNVGQAGESNTTRIGQAQDRTFIAGVSGITTDLPTGSAVFVDTDGQLGTVLSSKRFKDNIRDMGKSSNGLMRLRPVPFRYKKAYANGERPLQYGLIAEEVAEVYPELVVKNDEGQVQTVQYHKLNSMLLNEVQKQHRQIQEQERQITNLSGRLSRLEQILTEQQTSMR